MCVLKSIVKACGFMLLCRLCRLIFINIYALTLQLLDFVGVIDSYAVAYREHLPMISLWSELLLLPLIWLFFRLQGKNALEKMAITPCRAKLLILSFVIGLSACVVVMFLLMVIPFPAIWEADYAEKSEQVLNRWGWLYTTLMSIVVAPIIEELVFRGLLYTRFRSGMPPLLAAVITSVMFGIAHGSPIWFVYTFLLGVVHAWLLERTGSLLPPILCHMAFNIIGQISIFPIGTPYIIVYLVYILSIIVLVVSMWRFAKMTKKPLPIGSKEEPVMLTECEEQ